MARAHRCGAVGFISRDSSAADVLTVLRLVRLGSIRATPAAVEADRLAETTAAAARIRLTPREWAVLHGLGQGETVSVIAAGLGISTHTCRGYLKALRRKLDTTSLVGTVLTAQRLGLLKMPEAYAEVSA
jgi:DNA-binding NarL/FixJ family response regulator